MYNGIEGRLKMMGDIPSSQKVAEYVMNLLEERQV